MSTQAARAAHNEDVYRRANESIRTLAEAWEPGPFSALCECSRIRCADLIEVTPEEYEAVRAHGGRFAIVDGHEDVEIERVVERNERFATIEKEGDGAAVAEALD